MTLALSSALPRAVLIASSELKNSNLTALDLAREERNWQLRIVGSQLELYLVQLDSRFNTPTYSLIIICIVCAF